MTETAAAHLDRSMKAKRKYFQQLARSACDLGVFLEAKYWDRAKH